MRYKDIIKYAWHLTNKEKKNFFPFGFVPSFFSTIVGVLYIAYQVLAFHDWLNKHGDSESGSIFTLLKPVLIFLKTHPSWTVFLVVMGFFIFLMYTFSPIICGGALIDLIAKKVNDRPLKGGLMEGFESFFPLMEFAAITSFFHAVPIFTEISMVLRNFSSGTWIIVIPLLFAILIIGLFLSLLFIFAEHFIVLEDMPVLKSIKRSVVLVLSNVKDTLFLGITIALITARVFVNIILVLLIPLLILAIAGFMASVAVKWVGILVGIIIGVSLVIFGAYLLAGFHIFTYAIWTISFIYFRKEEIKYKKRELIAENEN